MTTRILVVEDDVHRIAKLTEWLPDDIRLVNARSAGAAIGILHRDRGDVYDGIMLDYDLQDRTATDADKSMSGQDVMVAILVNVSRSVPILVHSMNRSKPRRVVDELRDAGFTVGRVPMFRLSKARFLEWLDHVRD